MAGRTQPQDDGRSAGHYFDRSPSVRSRPSRVTAEFPGAALDLATDAGMFSPSRLDPGTTVLLAALARAGTGGADTGGTATGDSGTVPELPDGDLVDVGAGYGPIALCLAQWHPERTVWAVEVNERARALCEANVVAAGLGERVRVVAPGDVPTGVDVALVASNPPIRIGKQALHQLLVEWFDRLDARGEAWLVVQRHLGADSLARWISAGGRRVTREQSKKGYRVLRVTAGGPDPHGDGVDPEDG